MFFFDLLSRLGLASSEVARFFAMSERSMKMEKMEVTTSKKAMGCESLGWYHLSCMRPSLANASIAKEYKCPFCLCIETEAISKNGRHPLISRETRPELMMFNELLCDARDFYVGITEIDIVQDIVDQALACKSHLTDIVNRVLAYVNKDLSFMFENLFIILKGEVDHKFSNEAKGQDEGCTS
ncbi:uncharacterized protein LOC131250615 [Magnolia sinica]|uniref:uncharacterized protein LOC131250615 n=1 Tax=Magnolia sinica TaxID=86752 RepID=UPI00265B645C|nr:uncharacterized protein LOC131250615 [Magnolia sinica]